MHELNDHITAHTGLRGIAAVTVFLAHIQLQVVFPSNSKWIDTAYQFIQWQRHAVDLFFILSGYVLCHVYSFRERSDWPSYFRARFARIYPLYFVTSLLWISLDAYRYIKHGTGSPNLKPLRILANLTLTNGLYDNAIAHSINPPAWSVSVEVFLYLLIFPLLYWVFKRIHPRRVILIWLWIAANIVLLMMSHHFLAPTLIPHRFSWICRGIFGFSAGYGLRQVAHIRYGTSAPWWADLAGLLTIAAVVAILAMDTSMRLLIPCFGVLVFITNWNSGIVASFFSNGLFTYLGERSYSIYLIHNLFAEFCYRLFLSPNIDASGHSFGIRAFTYGTIIVGTFVLSELSYRYFELPCRNWLRFRAK